MTPNPMPRRRAARYPALDGVRGLAIAAVLFYHSLYALPGTGALTSVVRMVARTGWVGVELFFVLSGFLITRLLLASRGTAGYFRRFYVRRALRILPPYYALLASLTIALPFLTPAAAATFRPLLTRSAWLWGHAFNIYLALDWVAAGGSGWAALRPISHLWSLAVEEQFYLVWPVVVLLAPPGRLARIAAAAFVTSAALRALLASPLASVDAHVLYVLTPVHLDGFAAGAWLAAVECEAPTRWNVLVARLRWLSGASWPRLVILGCALVVVVALLDPQIWAEGPRAALLALSFAALVAAALTSSPAAALGRLVHGRALGELGRYSYTIYLVHLPIWAALGGDAASARAQVARCLAMWVLSGAVAWVSWRVLEQPALRLKERWAPNAPPRASAAQADPTQASAASPFVVAPQ